MWWHCHIIMAINMDLKRKKNGTLWYFIVKQLYIQTMARTRYFQWDDVHFVLYQHAQLDCYGASSLIETSLQVNTSLHSDTLFWFQLRREARKFLGYFVWKITILCQKIKFSPILGDARAGCAPCWIRPDDVHFVLYQHAQLDCYGASSLIETSLQVNTSLHSDTLFWFRAYRSLLPGCWIRPWIVCLSPGRVKRKNIELVFTSSRLSMHHYRVPGSKDR
jgi:hypothetical protein